MRRFMKEIPQIKRILLVAFAAIGVILVLGGCGGAEEDRLRSIATREAEDILIREAGERDAATREAREREAATLRPRFSPVAPLHVVGTRTPMPVAHTPAPTTAPTTAVTPTTAPSPTATAAPVPTSTSAPQVPPEPTSTLEPTPAAEPAPTSTPMATPPTPATAFDGMYILFVAQPEGEHFAGKTVAFKIGDRVAAEDFAWEPGGANVLNLTASSTMRGGNGGIPGERAALVSTTPQRGGPLARPVLQPAPPHVFVGKATLNGVGAPQGTVVSAWVDGAKVPGAEATLEASPDPGAASADSAGEAFAPLGDNLVRAWKFDAATQTWDFYDPRPAFASFNTVREVVTTNFFWMKLRNSQTVSLNGRSRTLYAGTNFVQW